MMLNFECRTGPVQEPPVVYPDVSVAPWWLDAKLGIFVHWGLYSVPAFGEIHSPGSYIPPEDAYKHHEYAEWFANTCRIEGSAAQQRLRKYAAPPGLGCTYEDLAEYWTAHRFHADALAQRVKSLGARYFVITTKHHDGFCLWDTDTTPFSAAKRGPRRDLIAEMHDAMRAAGIRFGCYFSGALDWHVSDFPPIESMRDLFTYRRNDPAFAQYCAAQLRELAARFHPDIFWNDIEWPDSAKGTNDYALRNLFQELQEANPEVVINDRFGVPAHGHLTREYSDVDHLMEEPWEATRGLGKSFGVNAQETKDDVLGGDELIKLFAHIVVRGGNLLLNVGLTNEGEIPTVYDAPLDCLQRWNEQFGGAVFGTRPSMDWGAPTETFGFTRDAEGNTFVLTHITPDGKIPSLLETRLDSKSGSCLHLLNEDTTYIHRTGTSLAIETPVEFPVMAFRVTTGEPGDVVS